MTGPLLQVKELTVQYRRRVGHELATVVNKVSFDVDTGTTLGVIGGSGAGKTTLAAALAGILDHAEARLSGEVIFEGRNLLELPEKELSRIRGAGIGMIFQDPVNSLDPSMPVVKQVAEPLRIHRRLNKNEALRQAAQLLAEVGVRENTLSVAPYAHQLSGGLCQRAMIAAALACDPRILIADEPTSALDTTIQAQIVELLAARQSSDNLALIFITHDLALVSNVADKIIVMHRGEAVETGSAVDIINRPVHPYTQELVAAWEAAGAGGGERVGAA